MHKYLSVDPQLEMTASIQCICCILGVSASAKDSIVMSTCSPSSPVPWRTLWRTQEARERTPVDDGGSQLALQKYDSLPSPSCGSGLFSALLGGRCSGAPWDHTTSQNQTCVYISFRNACFVTFSFKIAGLVVWNRCLRVLLFLGQSYWWLTIITHPAGPHCSYKWITFNILLLSFFPM